MNRSLRDADRSTRQLTLKSAFFILAITTLFASSCKPSRHFPQPHARIGSMPACLIAQNANALITANVVGWGNSTLVPGVPPFNDATLSPVYLTGVVTLWGTGPSGNQIYVEGDITDGGASPIGPLANAQTGEPAYFLLVDAMGRKIVHGSGGYFWRTGN